MGSGVSIYALVEKCLEQAKGDAIVASQLLQREIEKDFTLYREVLSRHQSEACWKLVTREKKKRGEIVYLSPKNDPAGRPERIQFLANANMRMLMSQQQEKKKGSLKRRTSESPALFGYCITLPVSNIVTVPGK